MSACKSARTQVQAAFVIASNTLCALYAVLNDQVSRFRGLIRFSPLLCPLLIVTFTACANLPSLDTQKQMIERGDLQVHRLTPRAFVEIWGDPTYIHHEFTQFFAMNDGSLIPQSRLALGEMPKGWETGLEAGDSLFLAYADRGWYLVFYDDRLVYRETMAASKIHTVGKKWKYEEQFKTRLEPPSASYR
ncbi:MAG TPA: hypothetical protein VFG71_09965 [Nitrospiraceae bacterium]|nr:hypothetical protein [Nitrospiraceae bacterium]